MIGLLWAEGVIAEVLLFACGAKVVQRLGPARMLLLGALAGVVRWTLLAASTDLAVLFAAQALHAFTFGAAHLGAIAFIARAAPAGRSEEHTSELQSLMRISYAVLCWKKKKKQEPNNKQRKSK